MKILSLVFGLALAASTQAQTWNHDTAHSSVAFAIKHMAVSTTRGEFDKVSIKLSGDPKKPATLAAEVTIAAASVNTKNTGRDEHLRKDDFFDVAKFPEITFKSEKVEVKGGKNLMTGTLTLHGVAKKVSIPFQLTGPVEDPWKNTRVGLEGSLTIDRTDYGMTGGVPAVGKEVKIDISTEFIQAK
ncbi:MAG: YceI family protein [Fibrobacterota bacterium]|nr:MAG: YceI family protein [Fibrobacterota bacterium]